MLPYLGCKRLLAPAIVEELGPHQVYFEPCCGGLAVLFAKPPAALETVSDVYGDLVNVAMCLASQRCPELYDQLHRILISERLLDCFRKGIAETDVCAPAQPELVDDFHLRRASYYLALSWLGRNGVSGTALSNHHLAVRWTARGGSPAVRWGSVIASIPAWHDRLRGVVILQRSVFKVLSKIPDEPGTAIYVDPPYLRSTRTGNGGGSRYLHDFTELPGGNDDHRRLAEELQRFKRARVVLSYYDHPRLDELYDGWTKRSLSAVKHLSRSAAGGKTDSSAPEVLFLNGPSYGESEGLWLGTRNKDEG